MKNLTKLMCEHLDNVTEKKNNELFDKLELGEYLSFKEIKAGDKAHFTTEPTTVYKIVRKYQNMDTARANLGDEFDELISNELVSTLTTGVIFAKSLPVCLVEVNGNEQIDIYSPEKYEDLETLVVLK